MGPIGRFFLFSLFSVKKSKKRQGMCHLDDTVVFLYPAGAAAVNCILLVTLPAQPQGTVSYSFLLSFFLSLPCRRSRRVLYLTRFFLHSRSLRLCISSVRFLSSSSSSVNTSKSYISDMTWPILTRLGHKYRLTIPFMSHDQIRVKGHVGVTGVKKVIFTKNATSPTDYRVWSCDSCTCISLTPSTKVMGLKIHPGSFGVTGVKKVIFTKNATSPTNYRVWSCDSCTYISLTPSTKVMGLKIHPGSFGVTGVKRSFSLKTLLLLQFTGYGHVTHVHASAWPPLQKLWV